MDDAIVVEGLTKRYRRLRRTPTLAVDGLDLVVPRGGVFGFLGPNGSGKTTTIRCLLALVRPTAGRLAVLGRDVQAGDFHSAVTRVGAVAEGTPHIPSMNAREQLRLMADIDAIPHRRVDELIEVVGLTDRATEPTKRYSLGMRQRFALAAALLKDPELLILDEPANGLDPAGMRDLRVLLRQLGDEGRTVFVSSHLLSEIEQMCDAVAIVSHGKLIAAGPVDDVVRGGTPNVLVHLAPTEQRSRAADVLSTHGFRIERTHDGLLVEGAPGAQVAALLGRADIWPDALVPQRPSLEALFLELTSEAAVA